MNSYNIMLISEGIAILILRIIEISLISVLKASQLLDSIPGRFPNATLRPSKDFTTSMIMLTKND